MKVKFEIDGIECVAESDYYPTGNMSDEMRAAMFTKLCNEAKSIAMEYIRAKYGNKAEVSRHDQSTDEADSGKWPEIDPSLTVDFTPLIVKENVEIFLHALKTKDEFAKENIIDALKRFLSGRISLSEMRSEIIKLLGLDM